MDKSHYITVDFDGTCVTANFPYIGFNIGAQYVLKLLQSKGHKIILHTLRGHVSIDWNKNDFGFDVLDAAVNWFKAQGINLYGVNANPDQDWTDSPKPYSRYIIDDYAIGCPLITVGDKFFVDWVAIAEYFVTQKLLNDVEFYNIAVKIIKEQNAAKEHLLRISGV